MVIYTIGLYGIIGIGFLVIELNLIIYAIGLYDSVLKLFFSIEILVIS